MKIVEIREFVKKRHGQQKRIQGTPYYLHPFAVAKILENKGFAWDYQVAGLFHDLLEDTETSYQEIVELSNQRVAEAVKLLSKDKNYKMKDYIEGIEGNEIAKMVKLADRLHNLSEAFYADDIWVNEYILETKQWYLKMAKNTAFEEELKKVLKELEERIKRA